MNFLQSTCVCMALGISGAMAQNGTLDETFANDAEICLINATELGVEVMGDMILSDQGEIYLGGTSLAQNNQELLLSRMQASGALDQTFGTNGHLLLDANTQGTETLIGLAQQGNKMIILYRLNLSNENSFVLIRTDMDGNIDPSFGSLGAAWPQFGNDEEEVPTVLAIDAQDRILVGGYLETDNQGDNQFVARLTADGNMDTGFSSDGWVPTGLSTDDDNVRDLAFDSNGNIVVVGEVVLQGQRQVAVKILTPQGSNSNVFGVNGNVKIPVNNKDVTITSCVVDGSDQIIVAGYTNESNQNTAMVKLDHTGALVSSFGANGIRVVDLGFGDDDFVHDILLLDDGYLIGGGEEQNDVASSVVWRMDENGLLRSDFGNSGKLVTDVSQGLGDFAYRMVMQSDDQVLVGGYGDADGNFNIFSFVYRVNIEQATATFIHPKPLQTLAVYPNPTTDKLRIPDTGMDRPVKLQMFDLTGRMVWQSAAWQPSQAISVRHLPDGMYTLIMDGRAYASVSKLSR
ncbi:T9SS type A sorting domain-containing protein [Pontibacter sp. G13]|uniref:T9SS type A sorting domain-containing protein n=1 Tax=Pontibacter sp. G13 TaxID=3074898 RepID=UPI00288A1072|nr:T9SS type A sorting domain-containing protein [Pontibacter sp. G13]WNJ20331.1 T9SS type A sorting domain-containing protein [Pontibacter sp. G13]